MSVVFGYAVKPRAGQEMLSGAMEPAQPCHPLSARSQRRWVTACFESIFRIWDVDACGRLQDVISSVKPYKRNVQSIIQCFPNLQPACGHRLSPFKHYVGLPSIPPPFLVKSTHCLTTPRCLVCRAVRASCSQCSHTTPAN